MKAQILHALHVFGNNRTLVRAFISILWSVATSISSTFLARIIYTHAKKQQLTGRGHVRCGLILKGFYRILFLFIFSFQ